MGGTTGGAVTVGGATEGSGAEGRANATAAATARPDGRTGDAAGATVASTGSAVAACTILGSMDLVAGAGAAGRRSVGLAGSTSTLSTWAMRST